MDKGENMRVDVNEVMEFLGIPEDQRVITPRPNGGPGRFSKMSAQNIRRLCLELASRQASINKCPSVDPKLLERDRVEKHRMAEAALQYYNATHGANFELSKVVSAAKTDLLKHYAYHLNFEAKHRFGFGGCPPKRFFAEVLFFLEGPKAGSFRTNCCMIFDPSSPYVTKGCVICVDDMVLHPEGVQLSWRPPEVLPDFQCKNPDETGGRGRVAAGVCEFCCRSYDAVYDLAMKNLAIRPYATLFEAREYHQLLQNMLYICICNLVIPDDSRGYSWSVIYSSIKYVVGLVRRKD